MVLDFDHTMIDANSDTAVFATLDPGLAAEQARRASTMPWTALMNGMLAAAHDAGARSFPRFFPPGLLQ